MKRYLITCLSTYLRGHGGRDLHGFLGREVPRCLSTSNWSQRNEALTVYFEVT